MLTVTLFICIAIILEIVSIIFLLTGSKRNNDVHYCDATIVSNENAMLQVQIPGTDCIYNCTFKEGNIQDYTPGETIRVKYIVKQFHGEVKYDVEVAYTQPLSNKDIANLAFHAGLLFLIVAFICHILS